MTCVGCGSAICAQCCTPKARGPFCPRCLEDWNAPTVRAAAVSVAEAAHRRRSTRAKLLTAYTLVASIAALASAAWQMNLGWVPAHVISAIGLTAGILMWKRAPGGWLLGVLWSAAQIVTVNLGRGWLNEPLIYVGSRASFNQAGIGINLIGVLLLIAFIRLRSEFLEGRAA